MNVNPKQNAQPVEAQSSGESSRQGSDESLRNEIGNLVQNARISPDLKSEKLTYIHEMLVELRKLSTTIDEPMVAYLIEMALLETNTAINVQGFEHELGTRYDGEGL